ncbi:hypothetical protein MAR_034014 [Mya arenaria]|uniref:VWFA domain-containing protein n=1 Tax=Mya arenaria TaxID=6604 RepID=A0ABY7GC26_MYAAR|nr:hypothetical protein MAR_034014 [Mya arenaria]
MPSRLTNDLRHGTSPATSHQIAKIYNILEQNGADYIASWAVPERVEQCLTKKNADDMLRYLQDSCEFARRFVNECLPPEACRDWSHDFIEQLPVIGWIFRIFTKVNRHIAIETGKVKTATDSEIQEAVKRGLNLISSDTLTGVIVDVSGSMKDNAVGSVEDNGEYIRSAFQVTDDVLKCDVSSDNHVFAIGVGGKRPNVVFDMLRSIQYMNDLQNDRTPATNNQLEHIYYELERNGATFLRRWASTDRVKNYLTNKKAAHILCQLKNNCDLARKFVNECLPEACRDWTNEEDLEDPEMEMFVNSFWNVLQDWSTKAVTGLGRKATNDEIQEAVRKGFDLVSSNWSLINVDTKSMLDIRAAVSIIRDTRIEEELSPQRRKELLKNVEPFIYDRTPHNWSDSKKVLVILSDGEPTDSGDLVSVSNKLRSLKVVVVCCFIYRESCIHPKRLFCSPDTSWEDGAKFLFELSSHVPSNLITRAILLKNGWDIEVGNNETKLFVHINHPDHIEDFCRVARNAICCQEYLSELLVTVAVDVYINQSVAALTAKEQFYSEYAPNIGSDVGKLIPCAHWKLLLKTHSCGKIPRQPTSILKTAIIDTNKRSSGVKTKGHAVVLTSYNSRCLILMNSWGDRWADMGFFRVKSADVLGLEFMDVYWSGEDLTDNERARYIAHGSEVARKLMTLLKGLQVQRYTCPCCGKKPLVTEYTGTLSNATCPKCHEKFNCSQAGNILAMNMYLTSLSRTN